MPKTPASRTFVVDCPECRAKVGAIESGRAERSGWIDEIGEPYGERLVIGSCPVCSTLLVGQSHQLDFEGYDADRDRWSDAVRVYPNPTKTFVSYRIPKTVLDSLAEGDRSLQASANIAACVMFGRALEGICHDMLLPKPAPQLASLFEVAPSDAAPMPSDSPTPASPQGSPASSPPRRRLMLGQGIRELKDKNIIDDRLFEWSQKLHAFRNLAAHAEDTSISRQEAEDLQAFVYAITEYVYDLADRYEEFKVREARRASHRKTLGQSN